MSSRGPQAVTDNIKRAPVTLILAKFPNSPWTGSSSPRDLCPTGNTSLTPRSTASASLLVSRGGLRFMSRKRCFAVTTIEVAVPSTACGQSIFVQAQIVYVFEIAEEKLFRCGVAYI